LVPPERSLALTFVSQEKNLTSALQGPLLSMKAEIIQDLLHFPL
jgi:hypothetical protein